MNLLFSHRHPAEEDDDNTGKLVDISTWLIGATFFLIPLFFLNQFQHSFDFSKNLLFHSLVFLIVMAFFARILFTGKFHLSKKALLSPFTWCFYGLFVVFFFATLFSPTPIVSFYGTYQREQGFLQWIFYLLFFLSLLLTLNDSRIKKIALVLLSAGMLAAWYGIFQWFGVDPFFQNYDPTFFIGRAFSALGNPDFLGQFIGPLIPIALAFLYFSKKKWQKIALAFGVTILLFGLFVSQSRAPILGLIISGGLFLGYLLKHQRIQKKIFAIGFSIMVIAILLFITIPQIRELPLIERFSLSEEHLLSLKTRWEIWETALRTFSARPWLGFGPDTFILHFPTYTDHAFYALEGDLNSFADRAHNEILDVGLNGGIAAILLYLALIIFAVKTYFASPLSPAHRFAHGLFLGFFVFIGQNLVSFSELSHFLLFLFFIASFSVLSGKTKRNPSISLSIPRFVIVPFFLTVIVLSLFGWHRTVILPAQAEILYTSSVLEDQTYDESIQHIKGALAINPSYAFYWYELLMRDSSSLPRAIHSLEQIEGNTMQVLLWKAIALSDEKPTEAFAKLKEAVALNPEYPHAQRAYADALYRNGKYREAAGAYERFFELVPPYWKWQKDLDTKTPFEQKQYRIFFKNVPDFWNTLEHMIDAYEKSGEREKADSYRSFLL